MPASSTRAPLCCASSIAARQVGARRRDVDAAQPVVAAQRDHDDLGPAAQLPAQARHRARGRRAADAGVHDAHGVPALAQHPLDQPRVRLLGREPVSLGERVAEADDHALAVGGARIGREREQQRGGGGPGDLPARVQGLHRNALPYFADCPLARMDAAC